MTSVRPTTGIAGLLLLLPFLGGCGGDSADDAGGADPTFTSSPVTSAPSVPSPAGESAVSCPYGEFSREFTPTDWTAGFVEVCVDADQQNVLVVNDSAVFLDVQPGPSSTLTDSGSPDASTFADAVNGFVPASSAAVEGHTMVPPRGWVVATGNPASALIGLNHDAIATTYAVDKLVGYVQSRLTNPSRAMAQRVAGCANEVQGTWSNVNDPTVNLDFLLADTALGSGLTCGSLIRDVVREAGEPPPQVGSLETEFTRFESGIRASVFEDLLHAVRTYANVLR